MNGRRATLTTADLPKLARQTEKEKHVLAMLFAIRAAGLPEPNQEVRFHPVRLWRMDMAYPRLKIAVEIHGGIYSQGRHVRGDGFTEDRIKMAEAQLLGWLVLEITPGMIKDGRALDLLERALKARGT